MQKSLLVPFILSSFATNKLRQYICSLHTGHSTVPQKGIYLTHPVPGVNEEGQQPMQHLYRLQRVTEQLVGVLGKKGWLWYRSKAHTQ